MVPSPAVKSWNANPKTRLTMTREIRLARRRGSRHQYRMSRASSAPSWVRGTARSRRGYSAVTALYPSAGLDLGAFEPLEAVPVMALSSDAENASTSRAIATTVIDRRATATSGRPAATSYGAANGAASGVQDRTSAMRAASESGICGATFCSAAGTKPNDAASAAMRMAARSRTRRERNAPVSARLAATHSSRASTAPTSATAAAAGPPRMSAPSTSPSSASEVATAGMPMSAAVSIPSASVRLGTGNSANRAGSRVSSTPKNSSGTSVHASTSAAPMNAVTVSAVRTGAVPASVNATKPAKASSRPDRAPKTNSRIRRAEPRSPLRRMRSLSRTKWHTRGRWIRVGAAAPGEVAYPWPVDGSGAVMALTPGAAAPTRIHRPRVRHFVRLKLRILRNGLRGSARRILLLVFGALSGLELAFAGFVAFTLAGTAPVRTAETVTAFIGAALVLAWTLVPLLFFGVDETLDPARFALLPVPRRTLALGMLTAALIGIPAVATSLALLGLVLGALIRGGPAAAAVALVGAVLALLLCVAASRALTGAFAGALRSRRVRDLAAILIAALAASFGFVPAALQKVAPQIPP